MYDITLAICTYNRSDLLSATLSSVMAQHVDKTSFEVLVIDNNSPDDTKAVAGYFTKEYPNVSYVLEQNIGLSHARNRAMSEAKADYIAYIDDDCLLPEGWIENLANEISHKAPHFLGGSVMPFYHQKKTWVKDEYFIIDLGDRPRYLKENEWLIGCNFTCKKSVLKDIGGFDIQFGMTGKKSRYSEEVELQLRYHKMFAEPKVYYSPLLTLQHLVRDDQMTKTWLLRSYWGKGIANFNLRKKLYGESGGFSMGALTTIFRYLLSVMFHFAVIPLRNSKAFPYPENYIVERLQPHIKQLSFYWHKLKG